MFAVELHRSAQTTLFLNHSRCIFTAVGIHYVLSVVKLTAIFSPFLRRAFAPLPCIAAFTRVTISHFTATCKSCVQIQATFPLRTLSFSMHCDSLLEYRTVQEARAVSRALHITACFRCCFLFSFLVVQNLRWYR